MTLPKYLPLFDPDFFHDAYFFKELEKIGYKMILLGGTGTALMRISFTEIREKTNLKILIHPCSPADVLPADLIFLGGVINSNSHWASPFGSGVICIAQSIAEQKIPYIPIAYFSMRESTAHWYTDAFLIKKEKIILAYCSYAQMIGYKWLFFDYEDGLININSQFIQKIKQVFRDHLMVANEFTPQQARQALSYGIDTIITPSDIYEQHHNPIELAQEFYDTILV